MRPHSLEWTRALEGLWQAWIGIGVTGTATFLDGVRLVMPRLQVRIEAARAPAAAMPAWANSTFTVRMRCNASCGRLPVQSRAARQLSCATVATNKESVCTVVRAFGCSTKRPSSRCYLRQSRPVCPTVAALRQFNPVTFPPYPPFPTGRLPRLPSQSHENMGYTAATRPAVRLCAARADRCARQPASTGVCVHA